MRTKYLALVLPLFLAACSSDDNALKVTVDDQITTDVENVALVEIKNPEQGLFQPGQPISLDFTINTTLLETEHVGVTFMAIPKDKVEQLKTHDNPEGYNLGVHYIAQLTPGEQSFTAQLMLPNQEMPSGEYLVAGYVDSARSIENEQDLEDNASRGHESGDFTTYAQVTVDSSKYHDFVMDKLVVGDGYALFPYIGLRETTSDNAPEHKEADLIGHFDASKFGSGVNSANVSATITINGETLPVHFWQEGLNHYDDKMHIEFKDHEQSHYFPYDIAINGVLLGKLQQAYDENADSNSFELTMTLEDTSEYDESNTANNTLTIEVPYSLYKNEVPDDHPMADELNQVAAQSNAMPYPYAARAINDNVDTSAVVVKGQDSLFIMDMFANVYGDKSKVAVVPLFTSSLAYANVNGGRATAAASGAFSLYMFNQSKSLFSVGAYGNADGGAGTIKYGVNVSLIGNSLIDESQTLEALNKSYGLDWEEEQKLFSTTFTIVIVPISVSAGVKGSVGINTDLKYEDQRFSIGGDVLTASLEAYATAGIDLLIASGGIGVDFLIISDTLSAEAYVDISNVISNSEFIYGIDVSNNMKAIEGEFYLWVKYPGYEFCCSFPTREATKTLYNTGALYDKTWQLVNYQDTLNFAN
ncbi:MULTISPECIES: hypothetical protein [Pseudoalteromonas]|uniref:Uncharacterized protein n=1 Tax=Pseudoalteromonas amylolytica TaxID=1859457 RepID=A0A1S1MRS8_9GAMM|nr:MULTISPECIES: hypothetical protein [Pseudoalteromonas]OHU86695.1 hypothetical protein BFC16_14410 [Pseudoalteromonas sp. JW3]OHU88781.1 hypothetical protein BET10_18345 [Pseudoalteromonas amylolytica]